MQYIKCQRIVKLGALADEAPTHHTPEVSGPRVRVAGLQSGEVWLSLTAHPLSSSDNVYLSVSQLVIISELHKGPRRRVQQNASE